MDSASLAFAEELAIVLEYRIGFGELVDEIVENASKSVVVGAEAVVDEGSFSTLANEPGVPEQGEMARDFGGEKPGDGSDLAIADFLSVPDEIENTQAGGIAEGGEDAGVFEEQSFRWREGGGHYFCIFENTEIRGRVNGHCATFLGIIGWKIQVAKGAGQWGRHDLNEGAVISFQRPAFCL